MGAGIELVSRRLRGLPTPTAVVETFGTTDPAAILDAVEAFCASRLGAGVADWTLFEVSVGSVHGARLHDGHRVDRPDRHRGQAGSRVRRRAGGRPHRLASGPPPLRGRPPDRGVRLGQLGDPPRPALAGTVAHAFTVSREGAAGVELPTLEQGFIADYEAARATPFSEPERAAARASLAYTLAYAARCEHSDAARAGDHHPGAPPPDSARARLAAHGAKLLT